MLFRSSPLSKAAGGAFAVQSFHEERHKTLIVAGTADDEAANEQTALALQKLIRTRWSNETVPIKTDRDVTDDDVQNHHLVLIGRPDSNLLTKRFRDSLPIAFGPRSFAFAGENYANAGSAVIAAADNPLNPRFSIVVLAGLSADATTRTPDLVFGPGTQGADVVIAPLGGKVRALTVPSKELTRKSN